MSRNTNTHPSSGRAWFPVAVLASLVLAASVAQAQGTPDLLTPSTESICDGYDGKAWGLCNAYCEAMDCDLYNDGDPNTEPHASQQACDNLAAKFDNKSGGALLPCEVPDCPCLAYDDFNATLAISGPSASYCDDGPGFGPEDLIVSEDYQSWGVISVLDGESGFCASYGSMALLSREEAISCIAVVRTALYGSGACIAP